MRGGRGGVDNGRSGRCTAPRRAGDGLGLSQQGIERQGAYVTRLLLFSHPVTTRSRRGLGRAQIGEDGVIFSPASPLSMRPQTPGLLAPLRGCLSTFCGSPTQHCTVLVLQASRSPQAARLTPNSTTAREEAPSVLAWSIPPVIVVFRGLSGIFEDLQHKSEFDDADFSYNTPNLSL